MRRRDTLTIGGAPAWIVYLAAVAGLMGFYLLGMPGSMQAVAYPSFTLVSAAVFLLGIRVHRPEQPWAFWLFALGTISTGLGDVIYMSYETVFGIETPYPSIADVVYIAAYVFWAAGLLVLVRGRRAGGDLGGWIDTAIAIVAFAMAEFVLLIYPYFASPDEPLIGRLVSSAYPVGDLLMVGVLVRLLVSPGSRTLAFRFVAIGFLACFASDAVYGVVALNGTYEGGFIDLGWMTGYALFAAAALHPSVRTLGRRVPDRQPRLSGLRLAGLAALALVAPGLFAYTAGRQLSFPLAAAISIGAVVVFLLVILRMSGLVHVVDRTMQQLVVAHQARDNLLHETLRTSEDDRLRLASELHDGPVQQLTALSYRVGTIASRVRNGARPSVADLQEVQTCLTAQINDVRRMMTTLRPGSLAERGLDGALRDYLAELSPNGALKEVVDVRLTERLGAGIETVLYRVAQEAIENSVRHADASSLTVVITEDDHSVHLTVTDDGEGFDIRPELDAQRLGLLTMRERIEMTGGSLTVASEPGRGTTIRAEIPVFVAGRRAAS